jgi:hypothetical protein
MKKIIELAKTYKIQLLILLCVILFFRSCNGSRKVTVLENKHKNELVTYKEAHDLEKIKSYKEGQIDAYNVIIDDVAKVDRPLVLMELHNKWINDRDNIKK